MSTIAIADSILTSTLVAGVEALTGAGVTLASAPERSGFAVIETGLIAAYPDHSIHPDVGIVVRDRGLIALQSAVRADELDAPTIWLRSSARTTELVARATAGPYFGFRPRSWVLDATDRVDAVVTDEAAALIPLESGYREDLTRAWFIITGLPLVTHVFAVPENADQTIVAAVADWIAEAGKLDQDGREAVPRQLADASGIALATLTELLTSVRWSLDVGDRRAVAELFARAGVASRVGPIRWYSERQ